MAALAAAGCVALAGTASADKPHFPGIWSIWGDAVDPAGKPWYRGHVVTTGWNKIEPTRTHFDFTAFDKKVIDAANAGLWVMTLVYTGDEAPSWLYDELGVPKVQTDFKGGSVFPYYLDPAYKAAFKQMVSKVADHLRTAYPPSVRERIVGVQGPVGASGDPHPYKDSSGSSFGSGATAISASDWEAFQKEMFLHYWAAYQGTSPPIHPLFNTNDEPAIHQWAVQSLPGFWCKTSRIGDRYQNNSETLADSPVVYLVPTIQSFLASGVAIRARSEMDATDLGWFAEAPVWNMYWSQLWALHNGQDMHNQRRTDLVGPAFADSYAFFTKYAGYKDPRDSLGAFVALRDGLDASDAQRFPESQYGLAKKSNKQRYLAIAAEHAKYGAAQSDPDALGQTSWNGLNDVGWAIWPGNYQLYIAQREPNATSIGLFRQGPKSQPFGRFARRFDHASARDAMYFDVDDGLFFGQPLLAAYPVSVRVVYLDAGTGAWQLRYDGLADPMTLAGTVNKTNSGQWKERVFAISDGHFGNRGPKGSDLVLANPDSEDDVFHMIELERTSGDRKGVWGEGGAAGQGGLDAGGGAAGQGGQDAGGGAAGQGGLDAGGGAAGQGGAGPVDGHAAADGPVEGSAGASVQEGGAGSVDASVAGGGGEAGGGPADASVAGAGVDRGPGAGEDGCGCRSGAARPDGRAACLLFVTLATGASATVARRRRRARGER